MPSSGPGDTSSSAPEREEDRKVRDPLAAAVGGEGGGAGGRGPPQVMTALMTALATALAC